MKNKWLKLCAVVMMLFTFVGMSASKVANAETPEVQSVNTCWFNKRTTWSDSTRSTYSSKRRRTYFISLCVWQNGCQLAPALPETGTGSQALMMVAGILALTGAAYFLVTNKNGKKIVLMAGLVLSGAVAVTSSCISE